MRMRYLPLNDEDDNLFIDGARLILSGCLKSLKPDDLYITHTDNWFGSKWLGFSGKKIVKGPKSGVPNYKPFLDHRVEVLSARRTLPPFEPNRVLSQNYFRSHSTGKYIHRGTGKILYFHQQSMSDNLKRFVDEISDSGIFFWYSGNSHKNKAGSLMLCFNVADAKGAFYVSFEKQKDWIVKTVKGTDRQFIMMLLKSR
jgi:hypothetical protein